MRIWYQSMAPIHHLGRYTTALEAHATRACSPGTTVFFHGAQARAYGKRTPQEMLRYPYPKHVLGEEAIEHARRAECEGYDAFILGSFSEPFLLEIRSLLDIPVVSMPEAALLLACSLSERFALVALGATTAVRLRRLVGRHALDARITGYFPFPRQTDEAELREFCREGLARYKIPERFIALDEFPVTRSGNGTKIQRTTLRAMAQEALDRG